MSRRALVIGARTALVMILIAGIVLVAMGVVVLVLTDPPEVDGWLKSAFGTVFGSIALMISAVLAIPSAAGVWAMAGATAEDAVPALPGVLRRTTVSIAVVVVVALAFVILTSGRGATLIDLGLIGLVALLTLGLAGAVHFSPHRGRAVLALVAMVLVLAGSTWFVAQVLGANQS